MNMSLDHRRRMQESCVVGAEEDGSSAICRRCSGFDSHAALHDSVAKWEGKGVQNPDTSCSNQTRVFISWFTHANL